MKKVDRFAIQEGLLSATWQSWNGFCRSVLLASLKGTTTVGGASVTSPYSVYSDEEIRFAAMKAANRQPITSLKPISGYRNEPTWGDLRKINYIVGALLPSNHSQLLSAFGSAVLIGDLQSTRNASAHITTEQLREVQALQVRYVDNRFLHPSDAMFWTDPNVGDYSWVSWVDEMKLVAAAAVQ